MNRSVFDLLLRGDGELGERLLDERTLGRSLQGMLVVALGALAAHGAVVGLVAQFLVAPATCRSCGIVGWASGHTFAWMPLAFVLAFAGALVVCVPSFYFYTQLAGLDASFRLVTAQAVRVLACTGVILLGVLPFYAALALAYVVEGAIVPPSVVAVGVVLPFAVGFHGVLLLRRWFAELVRRLPLTHERRGNFLLRLVLAWGVLYTAVAPVALVRIGEALAKAM